MFYNILYKFNLLNMYNLYIEEKKKEEKKKREKIAKSEERYKKRFKSK